MITTINIETVTSDSMGTVLTNQINKCISILSQGIIKIMKTRDFKIV